MIVTLRILSFLWPQNLHFFFRMELIPLVPRNEFESHNDLIPGSTIHDGHQK